MDAPPPRPVRFYPQRVADPAPPVPLTPSQAVSLARSPERAAAAARTAAARELPPVVPTPAPDQEAGCPAPPRRRWWQSLLGRPGLPGRPRRRERRGRHADVVTRCHRCRNRLSDTGRCPLGHSRP